MSIAITGPAGYKYQDLASVEVALRIELEAPSLVPEPPGGEDAALVGLDDSGSRWTLEVQAKAGDGTLTVKLLASYLCHFPERADHGCLLERLLTDADRRVLIITGARCTDALVPIRGDRHWSKLGAAATPVVSLARDLALALPDVSVGQPGKKGYSQLQLGRAAKQKALATTPVADLARALGQVIILDQLSEPDLQVSLQGRLQRLGVPGDRLEDGVSRLRDAVVSAKPKRDDAGPEIRRILAALAPPPLSPVDYRPRGSERRLQAQLGSDHVLLVAGPPRTGKTWLARYLAGALQSQRYEVREVASVAEAERFLLDSTRGERAALLDDPLGSREADAHARTRLADLTALIQRLPADRRLIVAQTSQPILALAGRTSIAQCRVGAFHWVELEPLTADQACALWTAEAQRLKCPPSMIDHVCGAIRRRDDLRDPGALSYLAQDDGLLDAQTDEALVLRARGDAEDLARALAATGAAMGAVLRAAAITIDGPSGVAERELAFVISGADVERPGFDDDLGIDLFGWLNAAPLPAYATAPTLSADQALAVETLQRRRFLEVSGGVNRFSHPFMRAGAQGLLRPDIPADLPRLREGLLRALACLAPLTAQAAARNLDWLWDAVRETPEGRKTIVSAAGDALRSIFPGVRDTAFEFLMSHVRDFEPNWLDSIPLWISRVRWSINQLETANGMVFIRQDRPSYLRDDTLSFAQAGPYLQALDMGAPLQLDLILARRLLSVLLDRPEALTLTAAIRFLSADESSVRAETVRVWLRTPRTDDGDLAERLGRDISPSVAVRLLYGVAEDWFGMPEVRRESFTAALESQTRSAGAATALFDRLVLFDREEHFSKDPPWPLFARLLPLAMAQLPAAVTFVDGRLYTAVNSAIAAGQTYELEPVLAAWVARLVSTLPHAYGNDGNLAVMEPLLSAARPAFQELHARPLLAVPNTEARLVFLKDIWDDWSKAAPGVRAAALEQLDVGHLDYRWLRATFLAGGEWPDEALRKLDLQRGDLIDDRRAEAVLGADQFAALIAACLGNPGQLSLGPSGRSIPVWRAAVRRLAADPSHPLFEMAFRHLCRGYPKVDLLEVLRGMPASALDQAFQWMLEGRVVGYRAPPDAWTVLLRRGGDEGRLDAWFEDFDRYLPSILEHPERMKDWLTDEEAQARMVRLLAGELKALRLADTTAMMSDTMDEMVRARAQGQPLRGDDVDAFTRLVWEGALRSLDEAAPRLSATWEVIAGKLAGKAPEWVAAALEDRRRATAMDAFHMGRSLSDRFEEPKPQDWLYPELLHEVGDEA